MSTANPSRPTGRSFRLVCPPEQMPQVESLLRAQGYEFEPEPFSPFCRRLPVSYTHLTLPTKLEV